MDSKTEPVEETTVLTPGADRVCTKGKHSFIVMRNGDEQLVAECTKCAVGYPIGGGTEVKDGHIYIHGMLVI